MEPYFAKFSEKRPLGGIRSTSLWRGYIATFEITNGEYTTSWVSKMQINWFTGLLVLAQGELIKYVHMGYGSTYEYYTL